MALRSSLRWLAGTAIALAIAGPAAAQPSTSATENLIRLLIESKVITAAAGEALLRQAESEAAQARAAAGSGALAGTPAGEALQRQAEAEAAAARARGETPKPPVATASADLPPPAAGTIRVPYIPEALRAQIAGQVRKDVMAQAKAEGWAKPDLIPGWLSGVTLFGDVRIRDESAFYSKANTDELIDFQTFNATAPIDINPNTNPTGFPLLDTRTDRPNRLRLRARLGLQAQLSDFAQLGVRVATGDDNSPISTNQLLGGGFAKKSIWLDQAYLKLTPVNGVTASFGRFPNPFKFTELLFDNDINFDGGAVTADASRFLPDGIRVAVTGGAFPLGYAGNNFPTNSIDKSGDKSKWLFSAQLRGGATFGGSGLDLDLGAAYHRFQSVQGALSSECALNNGNRQCSTDQTAPFFLRKGNTLFFLRNIKNDPASPTNFAQPQLLGLALDYKILDLTATAKLPVTKSIDVIIEGDYLRNLAFKRSDLCRYASTNQGLPINNITVADPVAGAAPGSAGANFYTNPCVADATGRIARYDGGNEGWSVRGLVGKAKPAAWGEWNVEVSYRYLQSDATLDSLADSDFHLGGTNAKGYIVGGTIGLFRNVALTGRWLSANQISGPPLAIDVLQFDLTAAF